MHRKISRGFTLVEVVIVLGIVSALLLAGFTGLTGVRNKQSLNSALQEIAAATRDTQKKSIAQEGGASWNIRFASDSAEDHRYEIFSGVAYSSSSVQKTSRLRNGVRFADLSIPSARDVYFDPLTGRSIETRVISLAGKRSDGLVGDLIVKSLGSITSRLESGVVGYWHFDEGALATAYDASGFDNDGSLLGNPLWESSVNCRAGSCLNFNGSTNRTMAPNSPSLNITNKFTVTAWIKRNVIADWQRIIGKYYWTGTDTGSWLVFFDNANHIQCRLNAGGSWTSVGSTVAVNLNEWTFVACAYDGSKMANYVNNSSTTISKTGSVGTTNYPITIAATSDGTNFQNYFGGLIDEVRIYNRALTPAEISSLYNDLR